MIRDTLVTVVFLMFVAGVASADVQSDITAGIPMNDVIQNAISAGLSVEEAVAAAMQAAPGLAGSIVLSAISLYPGHVAGIVGSAVRADPGKAGDIVVAALSVTGPEMEKAILQAAIQAGADPTVVAVATAAGRAGRPGAAVRGFQGAGDDFGHKTRIPEMGSGMGGLGDEDDEDDEVSPS